MKIGPISLINHVFELQARRLESSNYASDEIEISRYFVRARRHCIELTDIASERKFKFRTLADLDAFILDNY